MNNIHIKNQETLREKIRKIKQDKTSKLHVVSDYDRTLTKCFYDGRKIPSTIALIREGKYLTKDYPKKAFELFDKYNPIELDDSLEYEYRYKMMEKWWREHEKLLVKSGMHQDIIKDITKKYPKMLREGATEFFNILYKENIPLLIFSAGIGNIIDEYLQKENLDTPNVHVLSNTFKFNKEGYAEKYKDEIIHLLNKTEDKIKNEAYKELIKNKKNIILLGDSISDIEMAKENGKTIIKIGFLNEKIQEKLELYKEKFDAVITNDADMTYVNKILKEITQKT